MKVYKKIILDRNNKIIYEDSFEYIRDYYPYDGSDMEVTKFQNELNPLENFIFNQYYMQYITVY